MVRIGCNAALDAPVNYYDNASAELLGTCAFWIRDRRLHAATMEDLRCQERDSAYRRRA
jgi:hypothetical protein